MDVQAVGAVSGVQQSSAPGGAAVEPAAPAGGHVAEGAGSLTPAIAKLFGSPGTQQQVPLNVSYRVTNHPSEIVTVFSDPTTGEEVAQFPADLLIQIAQFFDKESGVTLDKSA